MLDLNFGKLKALFGLKVLWRDIERFDPAWQKRIELMAAHVDLEDEEVLDVGCGPMWLKKYLPAGVKYVGLDYKNRGRNCIVCDLNKDVYPDVDCRLFFVSGCLEYINDVDAFVSWVAGRAKKCVLSYCAVEDFPEVASRLRRGWVNHLSVANVAEKFERGGMRLTSLEKTDQKNSVMVFVK